jgi:hypothetical protein
MISLLLDGEAFTARQARAAGISPAELTRMVASGRVRRLLHDAYVDALLPETVELRCEAVALVMPPAAVISRRTAAWLHGFEAYGPSVRDEWMQVECVVPARLSRVRRRGVSGWEETLLPEDVTSVGGIRVTTPTRTAVDLARYAPRFMGLATLDDFCHRGLTDQARLLACAERFGGGRNIAVARELIMWVEPLTESAGESWLRLRLLDAGFPRPEAQIMIIDASDRLVYRLDLGYRDRLLGLEYDGQEFHDAVADQVHDVARRERLASAFGWETYGFHRGHVLGRQPTVELVVGGLLGIEPRLPRRW